MGCSGSKSHSPTTTVAPAPTLPRGVTSDTALPTNIPNNGSLRANVVVSSCHSAPGGWVATGTALNPSAKAITYTITVFFTTTEATVIDAGQTKVTVQPGARSAWTVAKQFATPPQMNCVLTGVG
jgi:hypothetical protein